MDEAQDCFGERVAAACDETSGIFDPGAVGQGPGTRLGLGEARSPSSAPG